MVKYDLTRYRVWFERHAGLGRWAIAVGAIAIIFPAWLLARAEYLRAQRLEDGRVNAAIRLIDNTASQFDPLVQQYVKLALEKNPEVKEYYHKRLDDPRFEGMIDFNALPTSQWPSIEVYRTFNEYFFSSIMLMETPADEDTSINLQDRITAYGNKFEALKKALVASRR